MIKVKISTALSDRRYYTHFVEFYRNFENAIIRLKLLCNNIDNVYYGLS